MATWKKEKFEIENHQVVDAQFPQIISVSRSTDIPAFYADWFFKRLEKGYSAWTNPFNGVKSYVSYRDTRFIVFWSKNPQPLIKYIPYLKQKNIRCYVQYTLNDYVREGLEKGVRPSVDERIETFKALREAIGIAGSVVWRFDPLILTDAIGIDDLLQKIEYIGTRLKGYTEKLVFSYADIELYAKVKRNLDANKIIYREWTEEDMYEFARQLSEMNRRLGWNYELATCGERINVNEEDPQSLFSLYGIKKNHCIDDSLIVRIAWQDKALCRFLNMDIIAEEATLFGSSERPAHAISIDDTHYAINTKSNRDTGQRECCGCMKAKDIGEYNTCIHMCEYCYANTTKAKAAENFNKHRMNPFSDTITG